MNGPAILEDTLVNRYRFKAFQIESRSMNNIAVSVEDESKIDFEIAERRGDEVGLEEGPAPGRYEIAHIIPGGIVTGVGIQGRQLLVQNGQDAFQIAASIFRFNLFDAFYKDVIGEKNENQRQGEKSQGYGNIEFSSQGHLLTGMIFYNHRD